MNPENTFLALLSSCLWTDILWGNFNPLLYEQIECRKERFTLFPLFTSGTHRLRPCSLLTSANWVNMLKRLTVGYESKFKTWNHSFHGSEQVSRFTESVLLQDRSNKKSTFSVILFCAVAAPDHTSLFSFPFRIRAGGSFSRLNCATVFSVTNSLHGCEQVWTLIRWMPSYLFMWVY